MVPHTDVFTAVESVAMPASLWSKSYYTVEEANKIRADHGLEPRTWE